MTGRAFLETELRLHIYDFVFSVHKPLLDRGYNVILFDGIDKLQNYTLQSTDIIFGSIDCYIHYFNELGIKVPKYIGFPDSIRKHIKRDIRTGKVSDIIDKYPIFVKPLHNVKQFNGSFIENKNQMDLFITYDINGDTEQEVYISEPMDILSEYRVFVNNKEIVGIRHYLGDVCLFPNIEYIKAIIADYTDSPISYTLDAAILSDSTTELIEINDMWATDGYGLDGSIYAKCLINRLHELKFKQ